MRSCNLNADELLNTVRASILPFESWEKLPNESAAAFAAFCAFRDYGSERNIKRALAAVESDVAKQTKKYRTWRLWSSEFQWSRRAAEYDVYLDKLKQAERRKTIEAREEAYREVTGKMLQVVNKKLDTMNACDLAQANIKEWMEAAIQTERDVFGIATQHEKDDNGCKQPELVFSNEFAAL